MDKYLLCSYASIFRRCHSFRVTWSGAKSVAQTKTEIGRMCLTFFTELISFNGKEFSEHF